MLRMSIALPASLHCQEPSISQLPFKIDAEPGSPWNESLVVPINNVMAPAPSSCTVAVMVSALSFSYVNSRVSPNEVVSFAAVDAAG